ncbi:hypothetical protein NPIL_126881 [Nephila pilipes]|uniref:Uncharacterized protein n=1 Tax=Nephila pilipes TaxID=299642 RepID=A0A8X6PRS8_NEPPI|nr:hypothetical protein NPIL_126881 [Nephila pilipes]
MMDVQDSWFERTEIAMEAFDNENHAILTKWVGKPSERDGEDDLIRRYVPYPDCRNSKPWSVKGVREIFGGFPRKIALKSAA